MPVLIVLLVLLILGELFTLLLQCRRGHSAWGLLRLFRYAHRGYHDKPRIPENSMAAFRRAIENGYGAELDVHLMRDGRLAVIHDASLKRTAGADVLVEDLTAEELKTYRLEGTDERIPLLEEVLELFQDRTPLIIELKAERGNHAALAEATCRMLDRYRVHYCIESFDPRCLIWLKKNRPEIVRGQLSEQFLRHHVAAGKSVLQYCRQARLHRLPVLRPGQPVSALVPEILPCPGDQLDHPNERGDGSRRGPGEPGDLRVLRSEGITI